MKKIISILLLLAIIASVLVACEENDEKKKNPTNKAFDESSERTDFKTSGESQEEAQDKNPTEISITVKEIVSAPYTIHHGIQGFAIHNGIIVQFTADNMIRLIDVESGDTLADYFCVGGHGSSLAFSKQYFEEGDEFPLLYICGGNDPTVYVQRISRTGAGLIARIKYDECVAGYWTSSCFDFQNKKMYIMGYSENSYSDNTSGKNLIKLTTWDMSRITNNDDGTVSYALESMKTYPYDYCLQSLAFYDGMIFEIISTTETMETEICVIDAASGEIITKLTDFPSPFGKGEAEGVTFVEWEDSCQMVVCVKGAEKFIYYGITFAQN